MYRRFAIAACAAILLWVGLTAHARRVDATSLDQARLVASISLSHPHNKFGGLSALVMSDPDVAIVLGDRATVWRFDLVRDAKQIITDIVIDPVMRLNKGPRTTNKSLDLDSEGLAILPSGDFAISFEGTPRVAIYPGAKSASTPMRSAKPKRMMFHDGWPGFDSNKSFEALAVNDKGRIHVLPEMGKIDGQIPVYRWDRDVWSVVALLPPSKRFRPVGADFGPDGRLYVLERQFAGVGFASQIRSFDISPYGTRDVKLHLRTFVGEHDNLEGLSIWRDNAGALRATMVADNNFLLFLSTELVEYVLP